MLEINLSTCSKADRKKVIKLAKSVGYKWGDAGRFKDREWEILELTCERMTYYYGAETTPINLPQDWDTVYKYLGIELLTAWRSSFIDLIKKQLKPE
jgi:hypothetical protein